MILHDGSSADLGETYGYGKEGIDHTKEGIGKSKTEVYHHRQSVIGILKKKKKKQLEELLKKYENLLAWIPSN